MFKEKINTFWCLSCVLGRILLKKRPKANETKLNVGYNIDIRVFPKLYMYKVFNVVNKSPQGKEFCQKIAPQWGLIPPPLGHHASVLLTDRIQQLSCRSESLRSLSRPWSDAWTKVHFRILLSYTFLVSTVSRALHYKGWLCWLVCELLLVGGWFWPSLWVSVRSGILICNRDFGQWISLIRIISVTLIFLIQCK